MLITQDIDCVHAKKTPNAREVKITYQNSQISIKIPGTCDIETAQYEDVIVKCKKRRSKRTTKCDKRTVTCDVETAQCEDETVKCEKK